MATITLGQAMRNAIEAERAAERFYRTLADGTGDARARTFLLDMARQEHDHVVLLEDVGGRMAAGEMPARADANVELIETAHGWARAQGIGLDQALVLAIEAENSAVLYYDALGGSCSGPAREFFESLTEHEEQHVQRLTEAVAARQRESVL
jgi:rubrerythrin